MIVYLIGYGVMFVGMIVGLITTNIFIMFPFIFIGMCLLMGQEIVWRVLINEEPVFEILDDVLNSGIIELASGWAAMLGVYYILKMTPIADEAEIKPSGEKRATPHGGEASRKPDKPENSRTPKGETGPYLLNIEASLERLAQRAASGEIGADEAALLHRIRPGCSPATEAAERRHQEQKLGLPPRNPGVRPRKEVGIPGFDMPETARKAAIEDMN